MFYHNMKQRFPMHFKGKFMEKVKEQSILYQIQRKARIDITALHPDWPKSVIHSLLAATGRLNERRLDSGMETRGEFFQVGNQKEYKTRLKRLSVLAAGQACLNKVLK